MRPSSIRVVDTNGDEHVIRFDAIDAVRRVSPRPVLNADAMPAFTIHLRNGHIIDLKRSGEDVLEAFADWLGKRSEDLS